MRTIHASSPQPRLAWRWARLARYYKGDNPWLQRVSQIFLVPRLGHIVGIEWEATERAWPVQLALGRSSSSDMSNEE